MMQGANEAADQADERRADARPRNAPKYYLPAQFKRFCPLLKLKGRTETMNVTHLECAACGLHHDARRLLNLCAECGKPLLVRYDLEQAARSLTKETLLGRRADLWRYREVLPVER